MVTKYVIEVMLNRNGSGPIEWQVARVFSLIKSFGIGKHVFTAKAAALAAKSLLHRPHQ